MPSSKKKSSASADLRSGRSRSHRQPGKDKDQDGASARGGGENHHSSTTRSGREKERACPRAPPCRLSPTARWDAAGRTRRAIACLAHCRTRRGPAGADDGGDAADRRQYPRGRVDWNGAGQVRDRCGTAIAVNSCSSTGIGCCPGNNRQERNSNPIRVKCIRARLESRSTRTYAGSGHSVSCEQAGRTNDNRGSPESRRRRRRESGCRRASRESRWSCSRGP